MKTEHDTLDESRRADFEEQVVCKILRAGDVIARIRQFKEEQRTLSGSPQLTLAWLRGRFPSFTLRLRAVLLDDDELILADLFNRFTSTAFFKAYRHWCNSDRIDDHKEAVGLVFNIDGVTFVLHNCQAALKQPVRRVIRSIGSPPVTFAFEELSSLLDSIDNDWTAEYATAENIGDTSDDD
jgi:hypothetical protein